MKAATTRNLLLLGTVLAVQLWGQDTFRVVYVESFRQGPTRVLEQSFEAGLDPQGPIYRERIKDAYGNDRFLLSFVPLRPGGDTKVTSWKATLADLKYRIYPNVLLASQVPSQDPKNNAWWLDPGRFARVPVDAERIIKVESFYCVLQVKKYHFTPLDSPYLDSMTVEVRFTNTDPRSGGSSSDHPAGVGTND